MGRTGPCYHCGINSTPLWRQGPNDKPVLCNACGSRYRHWGHLDDYFPRHSLLGSEELVNVSPIHVSDSENNGENASKRRSLKVVREMTPMQKFHAQLLNELKHQGIKDESSPEEVLLFDNVNNFIPPNEIGLGAVLLKPDGENNASKRRSLKVVREMTPMQKFHAQLLNKSKYQRIKDESSQEEVLLFDNVNNFIPPNEIGLGAVLLKPNGTP